MGTREGGERSIANKRGFYTSFLSTILLYGVYYFLGNFPLVRESYLQQFHTTSVFYTIDNIGSI